MKFSEEQLQIVQELRQWFRQHRISHAWYMLTAMSCTKEEKKFWRAVIEMNSFGNPTVKREDPLVG
jgi:hypothetical protein